MSVARGIRELIGERTSHVSNVARKGITRVNTKVSLVRRGKINSNRGGISHQQPMWGGFIVDKGKRVVDVEFKGKLEKKLVQ